MRRLFGFKDSTNTQSSNTKDKEHQHDSTASMSSPDSSSAHTPVEVHVSTEVHSAPDRLGFHPLTSTPSLDSSPASSDSRTLPPEIRVPTHPYPYWQGYTHTPSSSSQSSLESPMTPSHVSWLSSGNGNGQGHQNAVSNGSSNSLQVSHLAPQPQPPAGPSGSTHSLGRSSPNPHFPPPPPTNPPPNITARPKLLHPTKSTHSLRVPVQESFNQQLSPIVEQDYLSPEKRPISLPSVSHDGAGSRSSTAHTARTSAALTPVSAMGDCIGTATVTPVTPVPITPVLVNAKGAPPPQMQTQTPPSYPSSVVPFTREEGNDSPRPSPVSTFILRPLNRSISLSSTRTHQTSASATPPVIPLLDLKPEFKGQAFLTTPTSLRSRGLLDVPLRDDDDSISDRRESFITAQTGAGRESRYSLVQEETFIDAEDGFRRDLDGTIRRFDARLLEDNGSTASMPPPPPILEDPSISVKPPLPAHTTTHPRSVSHSSSPPSYNPLGPSSSDNHLQPGANLHPHCPTFTPPPTSHASRLGLSAPSLQDVGTSISTSSSFIDRRFAPSSLYLPPASERESAHKAGTYLERVDTIQVLFWLGFIAPWCWLIGGWLIRPKLPGHAVAVHDKGYHHPHHSFSSTLPLWTNQGKGMGSFDTMRMQHGYPFVAPSVASLTPPLPYESQRSRVMLTSRPIVVGRNRWVRRCRIAAVMSGVVIAVAFLVALIVASTSHAE